MIGEALEITIVVSMLVLVGYPSTLMTIEALRARRRRRVRVVQSRRCPNDPPQRALSRRSGAVGSLDRLVKAGLVAVFARVRAWMLLTEVRGGGPERPAVNPNLMTGIW